MPFGKNEVKLYQIQIFFTIGYSLILVESNLYITANTKMQLPFKTDFTLITD